MVPRRVSNVLDCGTDHKQYFLCPGREHGSIVEVCHAERFSSRLLPNGNLNTIGNIKAPKKKL